jgi:hypothetical protein
VIFARFFCGQTSHRIKNLANQQQAAVAQQAACFAAFCGYFARLLRLTSGKLPFFALRKHSASIATDFTKNRVSGCLKQPVLFL